MGLFLTDANCIRQREYVNIPSWHKRGYKGKGLTVFHDDVNQSHSDCCVDIIKTILPEATVLSGGISYTVKNGVVTTCNAYCRETNESLPMDEFIAKHNVSQINNSTDGGTNDSNSAIANYMRGIIEKYNLVCTGSAGNYGMTNKYQGAFIMVSGVTLRNGIVNISTSSGEAVDFCMFMGYQSGSSFSAPFLNGMCGLIRNRYGMITQAEIYEYLKRNAKDIGVTGEDTSYGWGLPIMPSKTKIELQIGNDIMTVDGIKFTLDQPPKIDPMTGRTLVPVRAIAEGFGATVTWIDETDTIILEV